MSATDTRVKCFVVKADGTQLGWFNSQSFTDLFKVAGVGATVRIDVQEYGRAQKTVGNFIVEGPNVVTPTCPAGTHWDATTQTCVPDVQQPGVIYDSNIHIDWAKIATLPNQILKVTDIYGTFTPNGKYFRMKAGRMCRMYLNAVTRELMLEHDGDFGRAYFGVCNYQSRLECEFKLDSCSHNASFKTRNRHQYRDVNPSATDKQRQGGMGCAWHCDSVENDLEVYHGGGEVGGPSKSLSPKLEANKWYKMKFSQYDLNGKIHFVDELDRNDGQGFKKVSEGDVSAPSQFFNRTEFETWSEFWIRLNANGGGKLWLKNIKMYAL